MIISIHQPQFLPWLGYFDKIERSDTFVFLDDVQFKKNEWQNRNKIKTFENWQWLTVPVNHKFLQKIKDVQINNTTQWRKKHLHALKTNYSKARYFNNYFDFFEQTYSQEWKALSDINIYFIKYLIEALGFTNKKIVKASDFQFKEGRDERLIDICKHFGGDIYLSGEGGQDYLDLDKFEREGIKVIYQNYKHPVYTQQFGHFIPNLSIIDLLFNCGPDSFSILKKGE